MVRKSSNWVSITIIRLSLDCGGFTIRSVHPNYLTDKVILALCTEVLTYLTLWFLPFEYNRLNRNFSFGTHSIEKMTFKCNRIISDPNLTVNCQWNYWLLKRLRVMRTVGRMFCRLSSRPYYASNKELIRSRNGVWNKFPVVYNQIIIFNDQTNTWKIRVQPLWSVLTPLVTSSCCNIA